MKAIKSTFSMALMSLMVLSMALVTSCSSKTPAGELVATIDKLNSDLEKAGSIEDIQNLAEKYEADLKQYETSDYVMTDSEKDDIADAMLRITKTIMNKSVELQGSGVELDDAILEGAGEMLRVQIGKCNTISDLCNIRM